jgi:hypothetical protein
VRAALDARVAGVSVSNVHWTDGAFVDLRAVAARSRDVGGRLVSAADSPALAEPRCFAAVQDSSLRLAPYPHTTSADIRCLAEALSDAVASAGA